MLQHAVHLNSSLYFLMPELKWLPVLHMRAQSKQLKFIRWNKRTKRLSTFDIFEMKILFWHILRLRQRHNIGLLSSGCLLTQKTQKKRADRHFLLLLETQKERKMGIQSAPVIESLVLNSSYLKHARTKCCKMQIRKNT